MNRFFIYIIFLVSVNFTIAQNNLIYNGSFEEYYSCPLSNDVNNGEFEKIKGWWKPTLGTSDYFNRCNTSVVSVPSNFWGYQESYEGDGYVGLGAACWSNSSGLYCGAEYIQTKLLIPLIKCTEYKLTMHVSLANNSSYAIGKLGAFFSVDTVDMNSDFNSDLISRSPQIVNNSGILSDSVNWTKIEGTFIAQGNEQFITIGYFFNNVQNDTLFIQDIPFFTDEAPYYYVDSVSLVEIGLNVEECEVFEFNVPNIFTPNSDLINDEISITDLLFLNPKMNIYNRWGNLIATLDAKSPVWDGNSNAVKCNEGIYYFTMEYEAKKGKQTKNGYIQLIRFL